LSSFLLGNVSNRLDCSLPLRSDKTQVLRRDGTRSDHPQGTARHSVHDRPEVELSRMDDDDDDKRET
jgi:hypothetical protein